MNENTKLLVALFVLGINVLQWLHQNSPGFLMRKLTGFGSQHHFFREMSINNTFTTEFHNPMIPHPLLTLLWLRIKIHTFSFEL